MRELSYESAFERLEEIMKELEKGNVDLDESLKLYEEGMGLYRHCNTLLENAQLKITKLSQKEDEILEENFEIQED